MGANRVAGDDRASRRGRRPRPREGRPRRVDGRPRVPLRAGWIRADRRAAGGARGGWSGLFAFVRGVRGGGVQNALLLYPYPLPPLGGVGSGRNYFPENQPLSFKNVTSSDTVCNIQRHFCNIQRHFSVTSSDIFVTSSDIRFTPQAGGKIFFVRPPTTTRSSPAVSSVFSTRHDLDSSIRRLRVADSG